MCEPITCTEGTPQDWMVHVAAAGRNELLIRRMRSRSDSYSVTEAVEERRDGVSELVMCGYTAQESSD